MTRTTSPFIKRIGRALKAHRKALQLSQEGFAEVVGKHRVNYWRIEKGKINIRVDTLEKLSVALNVRPWEILKAADEQTGNAPRAIGSRAAAGKKA